jgi:flagellar biosynthesis protein FlhB
VFLVVALAAPAAVRATAARVGDSLTAAIASRGEGVDAGPALSDALMATVALTAPLLVTAAFVAAVVGAVQAGGVLALSKLAPDLSRLSPAKGIAGLFSPQRASQIARSLLAAVAIALVVRSAFREHLPDLAATLGSPQKAAVVAGMLSARLVRDVALVLLAAAFADLALTRRAWMKRLRMSKDEVKRESKESEGDPQLKAARERAHHELLSQATISAVKNATVVIVNPTHLATALRYAEGEDDAPRVLAKGDGALAKQIVAAAEDWGVPVVRDVPLARALVELEVGDEIPEALYEGVAEVLRALWDAEAKARGDEEEG